MSDIFHDAYASVVIERERLKTQLAALAAENERLKERVAFLERADKLMTYDHKTGGWRWHFNEPITKDTFLPPK